MPVQSAFHIAERLFAISGDLWCVAPVIIMVFEDISCSSCLARVLYRNHQFLPVHLGIVECFTCFSLWIVWLCAYVCIASLVSELLLIASAFYCILTCVMFVCQISQYTDCVALGMCVPVDPIFHYVLGVEGSVKRSLLNRNQWSFWSVWCLFARFHSFVVRLAPAIMSGMTGSFYVSYAGKWCVYIFC